VRRLTLPLLAILGACATRGVGSFTPGARGELGWTPMHMIGILHAPTSIEAADSLLTIEAEGGARLSVGGIDHTVGDRLDGMTVELKGIAAPDGESVRASSFVVRSLGGQPVLDGVLELTTMGYALHTADDARIPIPRVPRGLTDARGARVWLLLDAGGNIRRFGAIGGR
jgi:hypothetical protein